MMSVKSTSNSVTTTTTSTSNGKSNGIATRTRSRNENNNFVEDKHEKCNGGSDIVYHSIFRKRQQDPSRNKVTCSLVVTLHKGDHDEEKCSKAFSLETYHSGNFSMEEYERLELKNLSFDMKLNEGMPNLLDTEDNREGKIFNVRKPASSSIDPYRNLHVDWSRFTALRGSVKSFMPHSKDFGGRGSALLSCFFFLLLVAVLIFSFNDGWWLQFFHENSPTGIQNTTI